MKNNMKKIIYIKWSWLGDIISSIPKLYFLKKEWYFIDWIFFSNFNKIYLNFLRILKEKWLIDDIIILENNYFEVSIFLFKNFKKYHKSIVWWIATKKNVFFWKILWKQTEYFIKNRNVNKSIIELENPEVDKTQLLLYNFNIFSFYEKKIKENYMIFYPSMYKRAIDIGYIEDFLSKIIKLNYKIIILWWEREKWFNKYIRKLWENNFISYLWKDLNYDLLANILHYSKLNILHNWWIMWLWNLVNKNNININTNSYKIWHPIADNKTIFNFFPNYKKLWCLPCEWNCILKNKFLCRKDDKFKNIENVVIKFF